MDPFVVLGVQCTLSLVVFSLLARWYVIPKINKESRLNLLTFLLIVNVFRYLPLSLFMPGQISEAFPPYLKEVVAHGDFLSAILALIALLFLKARKKGALLLTWIFTVVSITDMVVVLTLAMKEKVYELALGANYFTVSVYVPLLIVVQVIIVRLLISITPK